LVLEAVEAMVRAVVASLGRDERMMDAERFSGILDGASDGIVSVIAAAFVVTQWFQRIASCC
jgi:hypothetical protein